MSIGMKNKGLSLVETIMSMGLFAILLTAVTLTIVQGYRSYSKGTQSTLTFREEMLALESIKRALHTCEEIYIPNNPGLITTAANGFTPKEGTLTPVFVFVHRALGTGEKEVIAFQWTSQNTIVQFLYTPDFDPGDINKQTTINGSTKVLASSVQNLNFIRKNYYDLIISVNSYPDGTNPLSAYVHVKDTGYP